MLIRIGLKSDFLHSTLSLGLCFLRCFTLNSTNLYRKKICQLWLDIQDIIGPVCNWPPKIRNLFFTDNLTHYQRLKVCAFVYVNSLNPVMLFKWNEHFRLVMKPDAQRECRNWFKEFDTNVFKWQDMYQYNVYHHRYEFIDGRVKFHLPLGVLHPW